MKTLVPKRQRSLNKNGQSAIEFAFSIPFFLIFMCMFIELSFMFIETQRVSSLSRQVAHAVFQDCVGRSGDDIAPCVETIADEVTDHAESILKDFSGPNRCGRIIAALYQYTEPQADVGVEGSKLQKNTLNGMDDVVTVGEVMYRHEPITPIFNLLQVVLPGDMYEATIV